MTSLSPRPRPGPKKTGPKKTDDIRYDEELGLCGVACRSAAFLLIAAMQTRRAKFLLAAAALLLVLLLLPFILMEWTLVPAHCPVTAYKRPETLQPRPRYHGPSVEFPDRFTLVINSYKRPELLQRAVQHYSQCKSIDAVRVIWCEEGLPPTRAQAPEFFSDLKEVRYDIMTNSSLNMRFWPLEGLRTEAVLSLDDDIVAPCSVLDELFEVWRRDPWNMAGFYPRLHLVDQDCKYKYLQGFGTLTWHGAYSLVLTKAAMLHRDYLEYYSNHMAGAIRQHVDAVHNCEDLAMSLLVGAATRRPPAFLHSARVVDLGKGLLKVKGISSGQKHGDIRSGCLNEFAKHYGGALPLVVRSLAKPPGAQGRLPVASSGEAARAGGDQGEAAGGAGSDSAGGGGGGGGKWSSWVRLSPFTDSLYGMLTGHF